MGYEEDGHTILDLEETPIQHIHQEERNAEFQYCYGPDLEAEALLE